MLISLLALLQTTQPAPDCSAPQPLPPALAGWHRPAERLEDEGRVTFREGSFQPILQHLPPSEREGGASAASFIVIGSGRFGIALDQRAWVDVYPAFRLDGSVPQPIGSVGHEHGPACSGIRKIVWFQLEGGLHAIRLTGISGLEAHALLVRGATPD